MSPLSEPTVLQALLTNKANLPPVNITGGNFTIFLHAGVELRHLLCYNVFKYTYGF